jgi:hypothetical protein
MFTAHLFILSYDIFYVLFCSNLIYKLLAVVETSLQQIVIITGKTALFGSNLP